MMRAAVFYGKEDIRVEKAPKPVVGNDDVLIKVMACGICGTDVHIFEGAQGAAKTTPPTILGHEFSGIIEEVGSDVSGLIVGQHVSCDPNFVCGKCSFCKNGMAHYCENMIGYGTTANGGFAQYCALPASQAYPISAISFEEGAMAEPVACCLHGIDMCDIKAGSNVLVIGGGTIGLIMLQLAKISGTAKIVLSEPVAKKRQDALNLGADLAIDPTTQDIEAELKNNGINNIDTVIECVGLKTTMLSAIKFAGIKSTVMLFGLGNPDDEIPIKPFDLFKKEITLKASFINPYTQQRALNLIQSKKLDVKALGYKTISLDELSETLKTPSKRNDGKVFVNPWL